MIVSALGGNGKTRTAAGDRDGWRAAVVEEVARIVMEALGDRDLAAVTDLAGIEQRVQALLRLVGGVLTTEVARQAAAARPRPCCPRCGRPMEVANRRDRHLCGLTGDLALQRTEFVCRTCGEVSVPAEMLWQVGPGHLSPALQRVVARAGAEVASFERGAELVGEILGLSLTADTAARTTEALGAVAEREMQQAMAEPVSPTAAEAPDDGPALTLMVGMDATKAHAGGRWRDVKVGVVATLGPEKTTDPKTGHVSLVLNPQRYCAVIEEADRFYDRVLVLAREAGWRPGRHMRVLLLGDGGPWIWARAERLKAEGIEVVQILDIYHAREHIWSVAHGILGEGVTAHQWADQLCTAMLTGGGAPVIEALATLRPRSSHQRVLIHQAVDYFETNACRMDYARCQTQGWPLGSGAVESACRLVCGLRCKQPGMRWSLSGVQSVLSLRALLLSDSQHRDAFWARAPQVRRPPVTSLTGAHEQAA